MNPEWSVPKREYRTVSSDPELTPAPPGSAEPTESTTALEQAVGRYEAALPEGRVWSFPVTARDDTGIPSWSVTLIPGPASGGHGYGWTELKAKMSALGELHERLQSLLSVPKLPLEWASYADLCGLYVAAHVADPLTPARGQRLHPPTDARLDDHAPLEGQRHGAGPARRRAHPASL